MDERIRFVIRLKDGESMATLCREFQISRKTGYKIFERYEECGLEGLTDRARRPHRYANQLPVSVRSAVHKQRAGSRVYRAPGKQVPLASVISQPIPSVRDKA